MEQTVIQDIQTAEHLSNVELLARDDDEEEQRDSTFGELLDIDSRRDSNNNTIKQRLFSQAVLGKQSDWQ